MNKQKLIELRCKAWGITEDEYYRDFSPEDMARAYRRGKNKGAKVKEKELNAYYQNELDEVYKNYADRLKDVLKENEKLKIKVAYRHEVQTMLEKRIEDLEKENAELKGEADSVLDNWCRGNDPCPHLKKRDEQLTNAKEIIKDLLSLCEGETDSKLVFTRAEQFLSEVEK